MLLIFYGWIIGGANWIAGMKLFFHTFEEAALSVSVDWVDCIPPLWAPLFFLLLRMLL